MTSDQDVRNPHLGDTFASFQTRERIAEVLEEAYSAGYLDGRDGHMDRTDYGKAADRIIQIVREVFESDTVIDAFTESLYRASVVTVDEGGYMPTWEELQNKSQQRFGRYEMDTVKRSAFKQLAVALDAAFGEETTTPPR